MAFRAFYALKPENFATSGGQHTNAVYGFLSMLVNIVSQEQPSHMAVAFDVGRKTFRTEKFPEYKAQRDATPEEFKGQVSLIKKMLDALGISWLERENYEADDIIATLATKAQPEGFDILIVTGDRDYLQLVNEDITVLYPMSGMSKLHRFDPAAVAEKYGVTPAQYPDFAALRGDSSDNLPGIPKVGEKTATKWIVQYDTLDNLIAHAEDIKGVVGQNFRERIEQVKLNRYLTQMIRDMELPLGPEELGFKGVDLDKLAENFDDLQFGSQLRERIVKVMAPEQKELSGESEDRIPPTIAEGSLVEYLQQHEGKGLALVVDGNPTPEAEDVYRIAIVDEKRSGVVVDLAEVDVTEEQALVQWLESEEPKFVHDAKTAIHMFHGRGITFRGYQHDTLLAAYLLRPGQRTYSLKDVYQRHLQRQWASSSESEGQLSFLDSMSDATELLGQAVAVLELSEALVKELQDIDSYELYADLELPLAGILARMEITGIAINKDVLEDLGKEYTHQVDIEVDEARKLVNDPTLNLSSPRQLQTVLFDQLGLPKTKKTKTGYSTAAKEIEQLAAKHPHPFLQHLLAHREYSKMKSTIEGLIKAIKPDGRIHTTFNQTITSTGRLSSTEPNLQNIPVRTSAGRRIRSAFKVGEGYEYLLTADYSQIEMRVMAHLSEDPGLIKAYISGEDLHNYVGSQVFDVPITQVNAELRRRVKALSYGLAYGLSAYGLSQQLDIPAGEAKAIMESYFQRFGRVQRYLHAVVDKARYDGYTSTLFGRRRYLPELTSTSRLARENAERAALNAPIQGTAADIIKVAMIRVDRALMDRQLQSRVLLQVHDELVVEVAAGELDTVRAIVEKEMDQAISLRVPLEVSVGIGADWDEAAH
nr:DNA polymerase I [Corynebacterium poyangense]